MSVASDVVALACKVRPDQATLVPERRQELTTEGGLDVIKNFKKLKPVCQKLSERGIAVSLFIDPEDGQVDATKNLGVSIIEFHTGRYAQAKNVKARFAELKKLEAVVQYARSFQMTVNAGHGLKYHNTELVARIAGMHELNIGHSIIAQAVFTGLKQAVQEMKELAR
jgi:pyridoxine 5-phosphate synthase